MKVTELVGRLRVANAWWLYGAYTVDASRYAGTGEAGVDASLGFEAGNRVAGVPADMLVGSLEWRGGRLRAGATHKVTRFQHGADAYAMPAAPQRNRTVLFVDNTRPARGCANASLPPS